MKTFKLLVIAILLTAMSACTDFEDPIIPADEVPTTRAVVDPAALRASAAVANPDNPYAVSNMNKAAILYSKLYGVRPQPVNPSHEYVRFQAKDSLDYYILEDSLNLEVFDYPLDRILNTSEIEFYSNDLENGAKWLYAVVPKNYRYPTEVTRQVLQDVYLQDGSTLRPFAASAEEETVIDGEESEENALVSTAMDESLYEELLRLSMQNAGIEFFDGPSSTGGRTWQPSARIDYRDDLTGEVIPLQRVKVRVNTLMNVGTGYTDADGRVTIPKGWGGKFRNSVNYQVKFKTPRWKILSHHTGVAKIIGDAYSPREWRYTVTPDNKELSAYAAVHRALDHFYYKQDEINKPIRNVGKMRVAVFWDQMRGTAGLHVAGLINLGCLANPIRISGKSSFTGEYFDRHFITGTTLHELGHASHYDKRDLQFILYQDIVVESYATAIEYYFQSQINPKELIGRYRPSYSGEYTGIGEALLNQGYTISQIQQAVVGDYGRTWEKFKANVKSFNVAPEWLVDYLFANPVRNWDFNFLSESFRFRDGSEIAYLNVPKRVQLQNEFEEAGGAEIVSLTASPNNATVELIDRRNANITFTAVGSFVLQANIRLANGTNFTCTKFVEVKSKPSIKGPQKARIGTEARYALDDNTFFEQWSIGYVQGGKVIDGRDKVIQINNTRQGLDLVFIEPGDYEISAMINYGVTRDKAVYRVNVPYEGIKINPSDIVPGLYPVMSSQHKTKRNIIQRIKDGTPVFTPITYQSWNSINTFYAFNIKPGNDHPYSPYMRPIYRYAYEGNEAYDNTPFYFSGNRLVYYPSVTEAFYVFNERVPGSVSLYCYDMEAVDNQDATISRCRILSASGVPDAYFDGGRYITREVKLMGYVYLTK